MAPEITLVALLVIPVVLLVGLRVNAALVFLGLCLGDVLVQFAGEDAVSIVSGASLQAHTTDNMVKLVLLLLPAVLTTAFMINTIRGSRRIFNLLPAIGAGLLTALLVAPLLAPGLSHNVLASPLWHDLQSWRALIVAFSTVVCLLFLWFQPRLAGKEHGKHHKS